MAVFIDEPTPISRQDAGALLGTATSLGVVFSPNPGVLSASYMGNFYGSSIAKTGEIISLNPSNIMSVLDYSGVLGHAIQIAVKDATTTDGSSPSGAFRFRIGADITTYTQSGQQNVAIIGLSDLSGTLNPVGWTSSIPAGGSALSGSFPLPFPYDSGYMAMGPNGAGIDFFGALINDVTKANLIAGILPSFFATLKIYFAWVGTPPPSGILQIAYTPVYRDLTIALPPNYYMTNLLPNQGFKPATTRNFTYDNLARLETPYNILPPPYGGSGLKQSPTGGIIPDPPTALNGYRDNASLQSFYRQSKTVALGGPSYQYVPGDAFPVGALVLDAQINLNVFPPLYYVYGVNEAYSTIIFNYDSYSTNPLDSRSIP